MMSDTKCLEELVDILFWVLPLEPKSIISVLIGWWCGKLVYNVETSYNDTSWAPFRLVSLFKIPNTGLLFWITKNEITPD